MTEQISSDVFVSYKREGRKAVEPLVARLRGLGLKVWFDADLRAGMSFDEEILAQLSAAKSHLVCWTRASVESRWIRSEASIGASRGILVPIFLEPCQIRPPFNIDHTEDLSAWHGDANHGPWLKILSRLGELLGRGEALREYEQLGNAPDVSSLRSFIARFPTDPLTSRCREEAYRQALTEAKRRLSSEFSVANNQSDDAEISALQRQLTEAQTLVINERAKVAGLSDQLDTCSSTLKASQEEMDLKSVGFQARIEELVKQNDACTISKNEAQQMAEGLAARLSSLNNTMLPASDRVPRRVLILHTLQIALSLVSAILVGMPLGQVIAFRVMDFSNGGAEALSKAAIVGMSLLAASTGFALSASMMPGLYARTIKLNALAVGSVGIILLALLGACEYLDIHESSVSLFIIAISITLSGIISFTLGTTARKIFRAD